MWLSKGAWPLDENSYWHNATGKRNRERKRTREGNPSCSSNQSLSSQGWKQGVDLYQGTWLWATRPHRGPERGSDIKDTLIQCWVADGGQRSLERPSALWIIQIHTYTLTAMPSPPHTPVWPPPSLSQQQVLTSVRADKEKLKEKRGGNKEFHAKRPPV